MGGDEKSADGKGPIGNPSGNPSPVDALLGAAVESLEAGLFAAAEESLRAVLKFAPGHTGAFHLLAVSAYRQGRTGDAIDLFASAVDGATDDPMILVNYAAVLNVRGRFDDAEAACRQAIDIDTELPDAYNNLGTALAGLGRLDEADAACRRCISINPGHLQAYVNLANVLRRQGQLDPAIQVYVQVARIAPQFALAWSHHGTALRERGKIKEALRACKYAVHLEPDYADGHNNLGTVLVARGDIDDAVAAFEKALALDPGHIGARLNLGAALFIQERMAEAEAAYATVLETSPNQAEAHNGLAMVRLAEGLLDQAIGGFRRALALDPGYAEAWYNLSATETKLGLADIARMEAMVGDLAMPTEARLKLHFALGAALDRDGDSDDAFRQFQAGNDLRGETLAKAGDVFDADAHDAFFERMMGVFDAAFFAQRADYGSDSDVPVFVVGMPRSGTTLVEHITASHPRVAGIGERGDIARIAGGLGGDFPHGADLIEKARIDSLAEGYLVNRRGVSSATARVVDKTPLNFIHLGLIALLFPKARIIHCRRDPRDICLSCYRQNFVVPYAWSTDLTALGRYYRAYERLMDHWRAALPLPILDVAYEELVADQDAQTRRLIEFLELPWDDACLRFYETARPVRSASAVQVRRPMHAKAVGGWRTYERYMEPLLQALGSRQP